MVETEKIIAVDFKGAIEIEDFFHRLASVHPSSGSFKNYFKKYTDHPQLLADVKRRLGQLNYENVDLLCFIAEQTALPSVIERLPALAFQPDSWLRYRMHLTLRLLGLVKAELPALAWQKSDDPKRVQFCLDMFEQAEETPAGFAQQWTILRKATPDIQLQIISFLGHAPDQRAMPFLKAYAQCDDAELARTAVIELARRPSKDVRDFIEHLWKHHHQDLPWQSSLLIALRRIYLLPDPAV